eukprot:365650-Chlamydomonas_euryale.AAC.16
MNGALAQRSLISGSVGGGTGTGMRGSRAWGGGCRGVAGAVAALLPGTEKRDTLYEEQAV